MNIIRKIQASPTDAAVEGGSLGQTLTPSVEIAAVTRS
jgi:hypothetical protein